MIFSDSQEIINFYVSLSVLAHCGFNQDVVTKCLTSESRHEARVRGVTPCTAFSLTHETIPTSSLGALSYKVFI